METSYAQIVVQSLEPIREGKLLAKNDRYSLLEFPLDEFALQEKALKLSRRLHTLTLSIFNQDDTRLVLAAYRDGEWLEYYDSDPMHLGCRVCSYLETPINTEGGNAENLANLFSIPEKTKALHHWLVKKRGLGFLYEYERHQKLAGLLGIPFVKMPTLSVR